MQAENKPGAQPCCAVKLSTEIRGRIQAVVRSDSLPSCKGREKGTAIFLDRRLEEGEEEDLKQESFKYLTVSSLVNQGRVLTETDHLQLDRAKSPVPCHPSEHGNLILPPEPDSCRCSTQASRVYAHKQPNSGQRHHFHPSSQPNGVFWGQGNNTREEECLA